MTTKTKHEDQGSAIAAAVSAVTEIEEVETKLCDRLDGNPRLYGSEFESRAKELAAQIEEQGQHTPALVRRAGKRFGIVLGHKRHRACELLERPLRAQVVELDDSAALAIALSDKRSHDAPDVMLESEAVCSLYQALGSWEAVARHFGRGVKWVASRAQFSKLSAKARAALKKPPEDRGSIASWPLEWLEEFAALEASTQDAAIANANWFEFRDRRDFDAFLAEHTHLLKKAPWKLDDGQLVAEAGPCSECPKTSARSPELFGLDPLVPTRETQCLDGQCWAKKVLAHLAQTARALKEEDPKALVLVEWGSSGNEDEKLKKATGLPVEHSYSFVPAKKDERGARKVIVTTSDASSVRTAYMKPRGAEPRIDHRTGKRKKKPSEMSFAEKLAESKRKVLQRRGALELELIGAELEKVAEPPTLGILVALATTFGVERTYSTESWRHRNVKDLLDALKKTFQLEGRAQQLALWVGVQNVLLVEIALGHLEDPERKLAVASWLCEVLAPWLPECCLEAIEGLALHEVPDPAWWGSKPTGGKKGAQAKSHASASAEAIEQGEDEKARLDDDRDEADHARDEDAPDREAQEDGNSKRQPM